MNFQKVEKVQDKKSNEQEIKWNNLNNLIKCDYQLKTEKYYKN